MNASILTHLVSLYSEAEGRVYYERLIALIDYYRLLVPRPHARGLSQRDAILITYPDQVRQPGQPPLQTLASFCEKHLTSIVSAVHLLPFYPYTSDDGFSVVDYRTVDPAHGAWADIARLGLNFHLMFDAVINHVSANSEWFQGFLRDDPVYRDYFIVVGEGTDLSQVVRPRALPLLTRFATPSGEKAVWTTFSADQVDLNYQNPAVLLEIIEVLLYYIAQGAAFIRLDAIAYLWKEIGTPCIHLPQTHRVIQLFRAILDEVAPQVLLITETNVPHPENISYFGNGYDEAQLVYNFALPPLVLHTFRTGDASRLSAWASGLKLPSNRVTFFNFLASHDGIGLNPAQGILSGQEIDDLVEDVIAKGGLVSFRENQDGTHSPYELNANYFDALSGPRSSEMIESQVNRFMAAQAIMLALVGVPGIYFHSLFGSRGWLAGVRQTGNNRTINRQKMDRGELDEALSAQDSLRLQVFNAYVNLLQARASTTAFHPFGVQRVVSTEDGIFAIQRISPDGSESVLCLQSVARQLQTISIDLKAWVGISSGQFRDLVSGQHYTLRDGGRISFHPYQIMWLYREGRDSH